MNLAISIQKNSARLILLGMILSLIPFSATYAGPRASFSLTVGAPEQQQLEVQPEIVPLKVLAARALESSPMKVVPGLENINAVLDAHAKQELQLDWLVRTLDRTQTNLGKNGLVKTMSPVNDLGEIERRQQLIKTFINDPHLFNSVTLSLQGIAKSEASVLNYWNERDSLSLLAGRLYFNLGFFKSLNKSKLALEAMTLFDAGSHFKTLVGTLFLQGLFNQMEQYNRFGTPIDTTKIFEGLTKHVADHNFLITRYMHDDIVRQYQAKAVDPNENKQRGSDVYADGTFLDNVRYKEQVFNAQGNFMDQGAEWLGEKKDMFSGPGMQRWNKFTAWGEQIGRMVMYDYMLYKSVMAAKDGLKFTHLILEGLRTRMTGVADFIKAVQALEKLIATNPELQNHLPVHVKNNIALSKSLSPKMRELVALLNAATFKKSKSFLYSRGKVLYANYLFAEIKHELVPAMHAVAEIDAYCAIARLVKESAGSANKFNFVTFTNSAQAYLELDNCWISVLDPQESVANSMTLGQRKPGKAIITGPNGGGKSTWLKAAGQAAVMAQAWGIAPARKAHMSIFDAIRTSLEPHENLAGGISKFMAQKESMDTVQQFVHSDPTKVSLILLDEPYDGTVTDEIARRAGEFCDSIVMSKNCLAIIATHVMPTLENTKLYSWYHVDIAEPSVGTFKRTFKLKSGLAKRWFDDASWRARFIDWLSLEMRKKALAAQAL